MFEPDPNPRLFAVPVGCDFLQSFVKGLRQRMAGQPPEALARVEIFVNTRRMARRLHDTLIADGAVLLPKVHVLSELPMHPDLPVSLPRPVPKLRRQLQLAQLVGGLLAADDSIAPQSAKYDLAQSLAALLDELQGEGIPVEKLTGIPVEDESGHWQRSLAFLSILADHWDRSQPTDPQDRQRQAGQAFAAHWAKTPPHHPVLAIGSTGSRGETALFLRAVARLPQGAVVLPGLDQAMTQEDWDKVATAPADNPQSALARFCGSLDCNAHDVPDWSVDAPLNPARNALFSLALRPAPFTDEWLDRGPALIPDLLQATDGLSLIEAETPKEEALAVSLCLRAAVEKGQKAVLITPDRVLSRRVAAALTRWGILADDSAGRPLHLTPPGVFLRLIAQTMGQRLTPLSLVSLLKHPLTNSGAETGDATRFARDYEKRKLRGGAPFVDFADLTDWAGKDKNTAQKQVWADWVVRCLKPLETVDHTDLAGFAQAHRAVAEALAAGPERCSDHRLWDLDTGAKSASILDSLIVESDAAGPVTVADYQALFETVLRTETVREVPASHPNVAIWGTLEARVESADLVILGGLNDPVWPGVENPDPWLNRRMRKEIGLPPPERITGLSAHDFQQGCGAGQLVLSRACRDGDAPTVASRWVVRILNLMNGLGPAGQEAVTRITRDGRKWLEWARKLDQPEKAATPAPRPAPVPPVGQRFDQLSVTQIETLIRDPYAIYARKILNLRRLDPLGREPDALIRGIALHAVVEQFTRDYPETLPESATAELIVIAETVLEQEVPWPALQRIWLARLARIAGWFVEEERGRRAWSRITAQEVAGKRVCGETGFTLTAQADRIDRTDDGDLVIYDYKSGSPPSKPQTEFFNKQLQLEAAIAAVGGFDGVPGAEPMALEYIGLSGAGLDRQGKTLTLETSRAAADAVWRELVQLIASYRQSDKGFPARMRMEQTSYAYDFDHLARKGEWEDSDEPVNLVVGDRQ